MRGAEAGIRVLARGYREPDLDVTYLVKVHCLGPWQSKIKVDAYNIGTSALLIYIPHLHAY
jgi:hypothetical protein